MKKSKFPYIVLFPMVALLTVFVIIPIVASFVISFMQYNPLSAENNSFVGFANFQRLFKDEYFLLALKNTVYFVVVMTAVNIALSLTTAQLLCSLSSNKWRSLFRVSFFLPCVAPLAATSVVWMRSILPLKGGLINMILTAFGGSAMNWLGSASLLMTSIMIVSTWADLGYNIVLLIAGIQGIPNDFYEAAEIDGAGPIRRFFKITMPLLNKTLSFVLISTVISQFQVFAQFDIMAKGGGPGRAASVLSTFIYGQGFGTGKNMGYASAAAVIMFLIILVITMIQRRMSKTDWGY